MLQDVPKEQIEKWMHHLHKNINWRTESLNRHLFRKSVELLFYYAQKITWSSASFWKNWFVSWLFSIAVQLVHHNSFGWSLSCAPCKASHWIPGGFNKVRHWDPWGLLNQCGLFSGPVCFFLKLLKHVHLLGLSVKMHFPKIYLKE